VTSRIGDIVVDCADPPLLARFWCEALGYRIVDQDATGVAIGGAPVMPNLLFIEVPDGKAVKNRLHFDVCPTDRDPDEELERLLALGARRSSIEAGGAWTVLEDPEGNEFCLMRKRIPAEPLPLHE
jgi:catechol 2,3-dioxygenase-like lactoylglutathione lyase family enzyme